MIKLIGFDIAIRVCWDQWPFILMRIGKVHRVQTPHGPGTSHEIFPDV